jgi:hypothetical protein
MMTNIDHTSTQVRAGFEYYIDHIRDGELLASDKVHNLIPTEGLNHLLGVTLKAATQQSAWYVGLFEGNYTPTSTITAATVVATATECTAYTESTREVWTGGSVANGTVSNSDSRAEFTMNATKAVYGAFLISSAAKSSGSGVLLSIARFPTVKNVESGDVLQVRVEYTSVSA